MNIIRRPDPSFDEPLVLPLAGTYIMCIVPQLLDYANLDAAFDIEASPPSPSDHFIVESDELSLSDDDADADSSDENGDDDEKQTESSGQRDMEKSQGHDDAAEDDALMNGGRSLENPPSPSFGDLLISKRTHQATAFEVRNDKQD